MAIINKNNHIDSAIEEDEIDNHELTQQSQSQPATTITANDSESPFESKVRRRSSVRRGSSSKSRKPSFLSDRSIFNITPATTKNNRKWSHTTNAAYEENEIGSNIHLPTLAPEPSIKEEDPSSTKDDKEDKEDSKDSKDDFESELRSKSYASSKSSLSVGDKDENKLKSPRGVAIILVTCSAQFLDNQWVTSVNIALPQISKDLGIAEGSMSWLVAAYTLTFGGFLLLAGALADRYGRRSMFCIGMIEMAIFTIAVGVSQTGIQCIIFRAFQGLGAAMSVPSAIGVITNYFVGKERHKAMSLFGASGAVGFVVGLVLSGILSGTIGWRYLFYILTPILIIISVGGWFAFPKDVFPDTPRPKLDILGSFTGTASMILLVFALSQSEISGWKTPTIIVPLILSFLVIILFHFIEKKVPNPVLPPYLWSQSSFAGIFAAGFFLYCSWSSIIYYQTLVAQETVGLDSLIAGVSFIPMGVVGICFSLMVGPLVERFPIKPILIVGYIFLVASPYPAAFTPVHGSFWAYVLPTAIIGIIGVSFAHNVGTIALVASVPPQAKSLAGGLINTAFQIGAAVGLSLASVTNQKVNELQPVDIQNEPEGIQKGYQAALFLCSGFAFISLVLTTIFTRSGQKADSGMIVH